MLTFKKTKASSPKSSNSSRWVKSLKKGNDSPTSSTKDLYGYGDGAPTTAATTKPNNEEEDCIYGYGDGKHHEYDRTRVPRRSSMKGSNPGRRESIGACCSSSSSKVEVEIHVPGKGLQRIERRRSIDFNTKGVRIEQVPKIPFEDEDKVWLQPDEFDRIKQERREMRRKMQSGDIMPWEEEETRGLEKYVDDGTSSTTKHNGWNAVFDEQEIQDMVGEYNDQKIADAYKSSTSFMQHKATVMGRSDALEVHEYLKSPRTQKLMMKQMRRLSC